MRIAIIGANGMLSVALTKSFMADGHSVDVFGLDAPQGYDCSNFYPCNLLKDLLDYDTLMQSEMIVYASGAGVQAALSTPSTLMYALNVSAPIEITLQLKKREYRGVYVSFGSYMEIGINDEDGKAFSEDEIICSTLPVSNDYALSKRLYGRYMKDFSADFNFYHFLLPNMFSYDDFKPGTRLIPYTLKYIQEYIAGMNPTAPSFSAGTQTREFILMEDIFPLIIKAAQERIPSGIYNMGGGKFQSIRELIESIFAFFKVPCKEEYFGKSQRRDGDIKSLRLSADKLKSTLGVLPSTSLIDVLKTINL